MTPEEFEKIKIHPIVGAEILERIKFPYPVVPIVRAHHERWDGTGYPLGLKDNNIPLGARILAAVDCLDALASDRQYRRALPLDEAMAFVHALGLKVRSDWVAYCRGERGNLPTKPSDIPANPAGVYGDEFRERGGGGGWLGTGRRMRGSLKALGSR